jgi:hypothetical protein
MGKRRPNIVRPNAYLEECIAKVERFDGMIGSNYTLVHWVKLQVLADDLATQLLPDDLASVSEGKVRSAYKNFEKQLKDWEEAKNVHLHPCKMSPPFPYMLQEKTIAHIATAKLTFVFNVVKLYMHELLMQHETGPEPPKTSRGRGKNQSQASPSTQTAPPNTGFTAILGILDTFLSFTVKEIRTLPSFQFAQIAHASLALMKMFFVAKSDSEFSKTAPVTQAMVEGYIQRGSDLLRSTAADGNSLAAHTFMMVLDVMRKMFEEHKDSDLQAIRTQYGGIPSTKQTQILDLEEPSTTPHRKTVHGLEENSRGALHLLSEVAMEDSNANGYKAEEAQIGNLADQRPSGEGSEMAAMGQLIGGQMGTLSDDDFFGIMQALWARSAS